MTSNTPEPRAQTTTASAWWTPQRTKLAGLRSLAGGVGGLLGSLGGLGLVGRPVRTPGGGLTLGTAIILSPVLHVLMAVGVLAADAWHGTEYGRRGRIGATLLALSLVGEAGTGLILLLGRTGLGELLLPIGILHGTTYMATHFFGSLYGVSLWRQTSTRRLTAGLFIVLFPAMLILPPLTQVGLPGVLIRAPLDLAFIALGAELWTGTLSTSMRGTEHRLAEMDDQ